MKLTYLFIFLSIFSIDFSNSKKTRLFLIGDSTMAEKPMEDNPERGWGMMLPKYFNSDVTIENHAKNGRSTKSFRTQGLWDSVYTKLRKGDYVFIQFGHNDSKKEDTTRFADAKTTFKENLKNYILECRVKGAIPVLITPVVRRRFDEHGRFYDVHGDYPLVVRELAKEMKVPLIDLHKKSEALLSSLGAEKSKELFLHINPGEYKSLPDGKKDDTHFSEMGANKITGLVVEELKKLNLKLANYLL